MDQDFIYENLRAEIDSLEAQLKESREKRRVLFQKMNLLEEFYYHHTRMNEISRELELK